VAIPQRRLKKKWTVEMNDCACVEEKSAVMEVGLGIEEKPDSEKGVGSGADMQAGRGVGEDSNAVIEVGSGIEESEAGKKAGPGVVESSTVGGVGPGCQCFPEGEKPHPVPETLTKVPSVKQAPKARSKVSRCLSCLCQ
jgi:hypothetical protein